MVLEHQQMHYETLLYMLVQSPLTRPPTVVATPKWDDLATKWQEEGKGVRNDVLVIQGGVVKMGHNDREEDDALYPTEAGWEDHEFGWDNEHPLVDKQISTFKVDSLPISNLEYFDYFRSIEKPLTKETIPSSWVLHAETGEILVRTLYGPMSLDVAGRWPLMASKVEIGAYCRFKGGRLPTEGELKLLFESDHGPRPAGKAANVGVKNWHPIP
jgi:formylglycine-generating enzyme required for sulfatase activity